MTRTPKLTYAVGNLLVAIIACFLVANLAYIYGEAFSAGAAFDLPAPLADRFAALIPAIHEPVSYLEQQGAFARAAMVKNVYVFNWVSALATWAAMAAACLCVVMSPRWRARLQEDFEITRASAPKEAKYQSRGAILLFIILVALLLARAFISDFNVEGYSRTRNMVHVRDRDFFLPLFYLGFSMIFSMVVLFFLMQWTVKKPNAPLD